MLSAIENILFHTFLWLELFLLSPWCFFVVSCSIGKNFNLARYIIMCHERKRNKELYVLKNKLVLSKDGHISHSCISDLDEQIEILNKAIEERKGIKEMWEKRGK